jgi:hypothetical protein
VKDIGQLTDIEPETPHRWWLSRVPEAGTPGRSEKSTALGIDDTSSSFHDTSST